jgi:hypothetical protein
MIDAIGFFSTLNWIDGQPLVIEPYRKEIFRKTLDAYRYDGIPQYTMLLAGRGKKNNKSLDLILAGLYCLMFREDPRGSDVLIIANDLSQADQDLDLAKKIIAANPDIADELEVLADEIRRKDGRGTMRILPANNIIGQHGKTACFLGFDEIHGYKDHALLEALAPDPTRYTLTWITSYDTIFDLEGVPLHDLKKIGMDGTDERMLFSWYSGDYCTDPAFANLEPELRANPSIASWPEGRGYLEQQRRRLPSSRFRRLHLNLPGAPTGAFFDQGIVERAIVAGRQVIEPQDGIDYLAFVDMSGGSNDDATLGIAHWTGEKAVLDLLISQGVPTPFNPRLAISGPFAAACARYRCREVHSDAYAGQTFRHDFSDLGIDYIVEKQTRTDLYENLEVALNAGQVELLDIAKLRRELMTIVARGASLDHMPGQHDDWATSAAGALTLVNPDIGNTTPNILEFYKRQVDAITKVPSPTTAREDAVGTRPANYVRVVVPINVSHVFGVSGTPYLVAVENDERIVWMAPDDAQAQISSALNVPFLESNSKLRQQLGNKPPQPRGIKIDDWLQAIEDQRPIDYSNKGAMTRQTLEMLRRAR